MRSSTHRNQSTSWSPSATENIKKAFSMSAVRATRKDQNRIRMSEIFWLNFGPVCKQSFREGSSDLAHSIIDNTQLGGSLISADDSMVWQVMDLAQGKAVSTTGSIIPFFS